MIEATAVAHPNVALVKYWGKANDTYNIPATPSVSIALGAFRTETKVVESKCDRIYINGSKRNDPKIWNWLGDLRRE